MSGDLCGGTGTLACATVHMGAQPVSRRAVPQAMPIKLTSENYKIIVAAGLVSAISLAVSVKYFWRAFPEASIEFRVNRDDSEPLAHKFLTERGIKVEGYRHAAIFDFDDDAKVYLERTQGLERMNRLTRGPIHLWRWTHRWFRPQQKEEFRVEITPQGQVVGFEHQIPEAAPGANLDAAAARVLAENFLREVMKRDLAGLEFLETETEKRPARTDHSFTWKQKDVDLGDGSLRIAVEVGGDQVSDYHEFVKVPEQWSRDYEKLRSRNNAAQLVDEVLFVLLTVALLVILVQRLRDRDVPTRLAIVFGLVAALLYFLGRLNSFSLEEFGYKTTDPYSSFWTTFLRNSILSALGIGAFIALLVAGSEPVYREGYPKLLALRRAISWTGLRTRSFLMANVVGIALTFFFFAYQTTFYLIAEKLGAWAPADVPFSDLLNTRIPWVMVLFIGFFPAVSEEMQFRAFAIPFLAKLLRSQPVALVGAAFIWGFLHSAYPNQPFFIRGIEVGLGGIVTGLVMLRFGLLATLIWHYSVDALYTAFLLLRSPNHYLMVSGGVAAGVMLLPLVVAIVAYLRAGSFVDEAPLTNSSVGVSREPRKAALAEPEAAPAYTPIAKSRLLFGGAAIVVFVGVALIRVHRFGEHVKLRVTRQQATLTANQFLRDRRLDPAKYREVAWLDQNVDSLALKYLLQHRSIEDTDRIYGQATRLLLWQVRYFRPLEKEEHLVFVDSETGLVFGYRHLLDENAPGPSLSSDKARRLAESAVTQAGYRIGEFELQNSQTEKRKARQDYTLTWQAKSGDPRNVGEAHYRLEVRLAGDQVVGFSRSFKLPEEWEREQQATRLGNSILTGLSALLFVGMLGGGLVLLIMQLRRDAIPWRQAMKVGVLLAILQLLAELNRLSVLERGYPTAYPLTIFRVILAAVLIVIPLLAGLAGCLVVGLCLSLYPEAWHVLRGSARRLWGRDAIVALLLSLAAGVALDRLTALAFSRFHAYAPPRADLVPSGLDTYAPGADLFLHALLWSFFYAAAVGLIIYAVRQGLALRAWWLWVGAALILVRLGPAQAHSVAEYFLGWGMNFVPLVVAVGIVGLFLRNNVLGYLITALCVPLAGPLVQLVSQPAPFARWQGALLGALVVTVLAWLLLAVGGPFPAASDRG